LNVGKTAAPLFKDKEENVPCEMQTEKRQGGSANPGGLKKDLRRTAGWEHDREWKDGEQKKIQEKGDGL